MNVSRDDFLGTTLSKSDQANAADLLGGPLLGTIVDIQMTGSSDQPVSIFLDSHPQPWKPSKTFRRVLATCWPESPSEWIGRQVVIYCDPTIKWAGEPVGGIAISHLSHITKSVPVSVNAAKNKKRTVTVEPYRPTEAPKSDPVYWPDDAFEKQVKRATDSILSDGKQAADIIAALEKKALLTAGQKARLQSIRAVDLPAEEDAPPLEESEDPFAE